MSKNLVSVDLNDLFHIAQSGDECKVLKYNLTLEELQKCDFLEPDNRTVKAHLLTITSPSDDDLKTDDVATLLKYVASAQSDKSLIWGCGSDDSLSTFEVRIVKVYEGKDK